MQTQKGMTLFEVLVAVVILSGGLLMVYRPFLSCLAAVYESEYRIQANRLIRNELWLLQETASRTHKLPLEAPSLKTLTSGNRAYEYSVSWKPFDVDKRLYKVHAAISWKTGARKRMLYRSVYADTF